MIDRSMSEHRLSPSAWGRTISNLLTAYYLGPDHPCKLRIWGWFRYLSRRTRFTVPYDGGGLITVDEQDWLQRQILSTGFYEPEVWETLSQFAEKDEVVWDVGAHIGSFSVRALRDTRVKEVYAFEPDPAQAEILSLNLSLNGQTFSVLPVALGRDHGRKNLYRGPLTNTGMSSLSPTHNTCREVIRVDCRTADELVFRLGLDAPTLLKLDVEGAELDVLHGTERVLRSMPPKAIVFEAVWEPHGSDAVRSICEYLGRFGYSCRRICRFSGHIEARENYLAAVRKSESKKHS